MAADKIKVAAIQMTSTPDTERNLRIALGLVADACTDGAKLVVLPECFAHMGPHSTKLGVAERLPSGGPILKRCQDVARTHGCELVLGGFWEVSEDPHHVYNSSVHLGPDGEVRAVYHKIHLFDVDLPDGTRLRESDTQRPGETPVTSESCVGRLGLSICYDVRFPELYRSLVDGGATVLTVPAAFTLQTGKDHWHVLLRARAIEAQCHVIAAAQTGNHYGDRWSYGHALICDPWGTVLSECGQGDGYAMAYIDPNVTQQIRDSLPSLAHRKL